MDVTYGDHTINTDNLPEKSIQALLSRGLAHFLGNEQAAKVSGWANGIKEKSGAAPSDDEVASAKAGYVAAALAALAAGTIGAGTRGPRGTATETVMRQIAEKEVRSILAQNHMALPSGDKTVKFEDGTELTRADLLSRRLAKHGDRIRKEAEAEIKAAERKAAKATAEAKQAGGVGVDALGL